MTKRHCVGVMVKNLTSGGAEKQSVLLARALASDCRVLYIIFNGGKVHDKYINMLREDPDITVISLKGSFQSRFKALRQQLKSQKVDVLFTYLTAANMLGCIAAASNTRVVTGLRNSKLPYFKMLFDRFLTNHKADRSVSNSYSGRDIFAKKGFFSNNIEVIPNCFFPTPKQPIRPPHSPIRIITVGRFVKQKDYPTAIKAFNELHHTHPGTRFVIVGYGELEAYIRSLIQRYCLEDCVEVHLNPDNIPDLLAEADIYLSTSLFEGTSNSIMEGMNASLPIVCTGVGDNDHLVFENVNGFLCPTGDVKCISEALRQLVDNDELRTSMGDVSYKLLVDNFSEGIFRERYLDLIKALT